MLSTTAEVAKSVRAALGNAFPSFKFSVRTDNYSMGSSVRISWTDGPTQSMVEEVVKTFERVSYDSATGEILSGGNRYMSCSRSISDTLKAAADAEVKRLYGHMSEWEQRDMYWRTVSDMEGEYPTASKAPAKSNTGRPAPAKSIPAPVAPVPAPAESVRATFLQSGDWSWLKFESKPSQAILDALHAEGWSFSSKRVSWYHKQGALPPTGVSYERGESQPATVHTPAPSAPANPAPAPEREPENIRQAAHLRKLADGMQKQIDAKLDPAIGHQNVTARRARIAAGMREEGEALELIQRKLRGLADAWESDSIPEVLKGVTSRSLVESLLKFRNLPSATGWGAEDRKRLANAGIRSESAFQSAKSALQALGHVAPDPVKEQAKAIAAMERELIGVPIAGYFPTPAAVVERMLDAADIQPGMSVLEPSAGKGSIADLIRSNYPGAVLDVVECVPRLRSILEAKGYTLAGWDFLEHTGEYDRIVMNPPFENGQDIEHVRHAFELLKPGGRLVSIMSSGPFFRGDRKASAFRDWLEEVDGTSDELPEGAFLSSERSTGVSTRLVVIDKPAVSASAVRYH